MFPTTNFRLSTSPDKNKNALASSPAAASESKSRPHSKTAGDARADWRSRRSYYVFRQGMLQLQVFGM
jgi:hypothetical protein